MAASFSLNPAQTLCVFWRWSSGESLYVFPSKSKKAACVSSVDVDRVNKESITSDSKFCLKHCLVVTSSISMKPFLSQSEVVLMREGEREREFRLCSPVLFQTGCLCVRLCQTKGLYGCLPPIHTLRLGGGRTGV